MKNSRIADLSRVGESSSVETTTTLVSRELIIKVLSRKKYNEKNANRNLCATILGSPYLTLEGTISWIDVEILRYVYSRASVSRGDLIEHVVTVMTGKGIGNSLTAAHAVKSRIHILGKRRAFLVTVGDQGKQYAPNPTMIRALQECAA